MKFKIDKIILIIFVSCIFYLFSCQNQKNQELDIDGFNGDFIAIKNFKTNLESNACRDKDYHFSISISSKLDSIQNYEASNDTITKRHQYVFVYELGIEEKIPDPFKEVEKENYSVFLPSELGNFSFDYSLNREGNLNLVFIITDQLYYLVEEKNKIRLIDDKAILQIPVITK